ncbi:unnamed protein product [Angiostrongylus costaricensis]|uniref:V-SNARE coiled-coil homology domain-containing protein n=1 Tax=Angiostrongylus costaricensis TaxID=334426 RepID=A0A158PDF9_ANGCS|nr:unnamed protein product [Angiostrongylus costaricensis]
MDRAKKKFASAIDGLRSLTSRMEIVVEENIQPDHCRLAKIARHGFPDEARCIAYDAVQRLLAIGTGHGEVRIIGDAGVDYLLKHEADHPVNHLQFVINEGGLITTCGNDMIHLWNYRQKTPEVVHSLQLNKEVVTCIHLPMGSKWLYVGTDKGNVYFVSVGTFQLSPYIINWNKAIDLSCRVHPGSVRQIAASPVEPTKLLIAFSKGALVQWNLVTKEVDRFPLDPPIKCFSWHYEGKQIITGNVDGSICIYNMKKTSEPQQKTTPHGQGCRPIPIIDWKHTTNGDQLIIFSGGMPTDDGLPVPALTFLRASKSATVLEMDHPILSFVTLPQVPFNSCPQQPQALALLLKGELMMIDLQMPGYPCIESPHAMDLHEHPVTCVAYYSDCPSDLIGALTLVGCKQRRKGFSERPWPVSGGIGRECATGHQELILTGHKDGSLKFWQASGENLQILYKLKTASHFERLEELEGCEKVSHAVKLIELCVESRLLLVSGVSGQVTLFRFSKTESMNTIAVVHIPQLNSLTSASDERVEAPQPGKEIRRQHKVVSQDSTHSPDTSVDSDDESIVPFKVRGAAVRRFAGYQPELACLIPWPSISQADSVASAALNSAFGVIALGMTNGLALVDIFQCALIYAWSTSELFGSDPTPAVQLNLVDVLSEMERSHLVRLNTDIRQKTFDRPPLLKAQSLIGTQNENRIGTIPSPSMSNHSLEKLSLVCPETVTFVAFIHSFSRKNDSRASPCLWIGTNAGASIALNLILPQDRLISSVIVAPSGTVVKLKGQILFQCFMDQSFSLASAASESYRENNRDCGSPEKTIHNRVITKPSLSPTYSISADSSEDSLVIVGEFEIKVIALPSFIQLFIHKCEEIPLVKAHATHVRGYPVLMCLAADGKVFLLNFVLLRQTIFNSLLHQIILKSSQVEKYTICSEIADQASDALGELFVACDLPDPPRNSSFLKVIYPDDLLIHAILTQYVKKISGGVGGGATRAVARTIPGPSVNMERTQASGISAGQAAFAALQNISERGEKLGATVDAAENLRNSAMNLSQRTGKLVEKLEKKKWYNF